MCLFYFELQIAIFNITMTVQNEIVYITYFTYKIIILLCPFCIKVLRDPIIHSPLSLKYTFSVNTASRSSQKDVRKYFLLALYICIESENHSYTITYISIHIFPYFKPISSQKIFIAISEKKYVICSKKESLLSEKTFVQIC